MAIGFNPAGDNGLTALIPINGGLGGLLSANGNVVNDQVMPIGVKSYEATGPGTNYEMRQKTGLRGRLVRWMWRIKTDHDANMNQVETLIQSYIDDGRPYQLDDADGRSTTKAVLLGPDEGTQILRHRQKTQQQATIATWQLVFRVLIAAYGDAAL